MADDEKSTNQILQALDALSHTLYQARANRRTNSLALPRSGGDGDDAAVAADAVKAEARRPLSRRLSLMSPFRSRPKLDKNDDDDGEDEEEDEDDAPPLKRQPGFAGVTAADGEKKGIWSWRPMRALSHVGMRRMGCLFSVEVAAAQGLPPSMNGLRLAVGVRKKETRDGALQTMPARVQQGAADFDETLYVKCHLYCSGGAASGKPLRFEPRPFLLSVVAVDAPELDLGRSAVDLSLFAKEFTDRCEQGECVRQWDISFPLAGKAKGGELVVKLAFQNLEDGGVKLYSQPAEADKTSSSSSLSSFARRLSKSSFSIMLTPKMTRTAPSQTPKTGAPAPDLRGLDSFKLDDATPVAEVKEEPKEEPEHEPEKPQKEPEDEAEQPQREPELEPEEAEKEPEEAEKEPEREPEEEKSDDSELPEFDVVYKGVEGQEEAEAKKGAEEEEKASSAVDEVVKDVEPVESEAPVPEHGARKRGPFGWRTVVIVVTPIAVLLGRTLAGVR